MIRLFGYRVGWFSSLLVLFLLNSPLKAKSVRIGAISDLNSKLGSLDYSPRVTEGIGHLVDQNVSLLIGAGDYVAGEDIGHRLPITRFKSMWAYFEEKLLSFFQGHEVLFAPSPGNHDASGYPILSRERKIYLEFWQNNKPNLSFVNDDFYPKFYSFLFKDIFFISLDNVKPFYLNHGDLQRDWVESQLETPQARNAKARIVYGHIPLYPLLDRRKYDRGDGRGKYFEVLSGEQWQRSPNGLERILVQGNVNLAVFAHSHVFYPGRVQRMSKIGHSDLRILSLPCMGSGNRYLSGSPTRSPKGFGLIQVEPNGEIRTTGFHLSGKIISKHKLPREIKLNKNLHYIRDDLF